MGFARAGPAPACLALSVQMGPAADGIVLGMHCLPGGQRISPKLIGLHVRYFQGQC